MNENSPKQLLRSADDRMLAGVAGGLGQYFRVDPVLMRIGFAILGLTGIGLLAYLALYIFVPEDDGWGNPVQARDRNRVLAGGGIVALLIAIPGGFFPLASLDWWWGVSAVLFWLAVLAGIGYAIYWLISGSRRDGDGAGAPPASPFAPGESGDGDETQTAVMPRGHTGGNGGRRSLGRVLAMIVLFSALAIFSLFLAVTSAWGAAVGGTGVIAVVVILCGALIALAAFKRPMRWLIVPALALALPAAAVEASGFELDGGYGDRVIRPARLADIPTDGYRMAAGDMTIDLRQADWRPNSKVELPARIHFGRISVVVPKDVCVASDIEVWAGGFEILGESDSDFRVQYRRTMPKTATPQLVLDGQADIGWIEVLTRMPRDRRDFDGPHRLSDPDATQPAHCLDVDDQAGGKAGSRTAGSQGAQTASQRSGKATGQRTNQKAGVRGAEG